MSTMTFPYAATDQDGPVALFLSWGDAVAFIEEWNEKAARYDAPPVELTRIDAKVQT